MNKGQTAKAENTEMCRNVRREMARHTIDCSEVQITVSHGTIQLHGRLRAQRGAEDSLEMAATNFLKVLRQRPGIRDVIAEWSYAF